MPSPSTVIPAMRYRDARAAIDWLVRVIGFEPHLIVPGEGDTIVHAQLRLGGGMIMLGSVVDSEFGQHLKQPDEIGGMETQFAYIYVPDVDAVYAKVKEAGAKILVDIRDEDYGGRGFICTDPEGHIWSVGTYDPWEGEK